MTEIIAGIESIIIILLFAKLSEESRRVKWKEEEIIKLRDKLIEKNEDIELFKRKLETCKKQKEEYFNLLQQNEKKLNNNRGEEGAGGVSFEDIQF